jgi:transposase
VAKASGKVCTRVPHPSRAGARRTLVWDVDATTNAVLELAGHLTAERIEKVTPESTSDYWRIWFYLLEASGWTSSWSTPAMSRTRRAGRRPTSWTLSGRPS